MSQVPITRFAPSPTGLLHLGHGYAALVAERTARDAGGTMTLRWDDIDTGRSRSEFESSILEDLAWLDIPWTGPVRRQSEHHVAYQDAVENLRDQGVLYPCFCTRREIRREIARAGGAPHGNDAPRYPGTCRMLAPDERARRLEAGVPCAWRLDIALAVSRTAPLSWSDLRLGVRHVGHPLPGDPVLTRRDGGFAYHLAVTVDDHEQAIKIVTRGEDLAPSTDIHRVLQALLGYRVPTYLHHRLIRDRFGNRLAKRDQALALRTLRDQGITPDEVRNRVRQPGELS